MKFVVFGATGATGFLLVQLALDRGHDVTVLVGDAEKVLARGDTLTVVQTNVLNADDLLEHMASGDVIISCVESEYTVFSSIHVYSESIKAIVGAMRRTYQKRLIFFSSWCVEDDMDLPWLGKLVVKPVLTQTIKDVRRMERYIINECPDIEYTIVRPPILSYKELDGRTILVEKGKDYSSAMEIFMPRTDLARYMLDLAQERDTYVKQCIAVGLPSSSIV